MTTDDKKLDDALRLVNSLPTDRQTAVLGYLRRLHPIHQIETDWNVPAEVILEAISRSPDLSKRGVRGLIAEAYFEIETLPKLQGWNDVTPSGNHPFDFLISDGERKVRVQVKTQRKKSGSPMAASEGYRFLSPEKYVVETQRTRAGKDASGNDTRPYKYGEFDVLAVNMEPSTGDWSVFRFVPADRLIPRKENPDQMLKFQPVPKAPDEDWSDSLLVCLDRLFGGAGRTIAS